MFTAAALSHGARPRSGPGGDGGAGSCFGLIFKGRASASISPFPPDALDDAGSSQGTPQLRYISTRGQAPTLGFLDAMLAGLARDGGLYAPAAPPRMTPGEIRALAGLRYAEAASRLISPFVEGELAPEQLAEITEAAYRGFHHPAKAPIAQLDDNLFVLELFHGPTLAFKDLAMQWLGRAMNHALEARRGHATIVGATSGDTGAAAIEAFGGGNRTDVFILFPNGRVSDVQRRQMTTVDRPGVHALAIEGTFDDCQDIVKALFNDLNFRDELALSGVNSINWARILAQIVYYFTAAVALGAPDRRVSFAVPTGNFGDILAGHYAKRMGLPIERLIIATNENDILARALGTGVYRPLAVTPTQSPSMDIQVSSNFERLLFEALGRDDAAVRGLMANLRQSGEFTIPAGPLAAIRGDFDATRVSGPDCAGEMARAHRDAGILLDPHSAIGARAARVALARDPHTPVVALATAHPAKFPDAVERATGARPELPERMRAILEKPERIKVLPNDVAAVAGFVRAHARARG
jgi:threonine synthase